MIYYELFYYYNFYSGGIIPFEIQQKMAGLKNCVSESIKKGVAYANCFEEILDEDCSMALMSLSLLRSRPELYL